MEGNAGRRSRQRLPAVAAKAAIAESARRFRLAPRVGLRGFGEQGIDAVYELHVEGTFSAAHRLRGHKGKCEALHGHNWKVEASVRSAELDELGMVIDFGDIKAALGAILDRFDHKYLNDDVPEFGPDGANPTTENIARLIGTELAGGLPEGVRVSRVRVWESERSSAEWTPEKD